MFTFYSYHLAIYFPSPSQYIPIILPCLSNYFPLDSHDASFDSLILCRRRGGAIARLKKWGLPKPVSQLFTFYAERDIAERDKKSRRKILGVRCLA